MSVGEVTPLQSVRRLETQAPAPMRLIGWVTLILAFTVAMSGALSMVQEHQASPTAWNEVVVSPGQTLWSIAGKHASPNTDVRELVYQIRSFNNLTSATIQPGQVLRVPVSQRLPN